MSINEKYKVIKLFDCGDERGNLVVAEGNSEFVPFEIKRVFYIYGSDSDVVRGKHANINSKFMLINVAGTSRVRVSDGIESTVIELDEPNKGLYIDKMLWKEMYDFSEDAVLLVLSSEHYDENEYLRDYDEYLELCKAMGEGK